MTKELSNSKPLVFEQIKEVDEKGNEFWGARKLSKILEYSEFRHFLPVVKRAKDACKNSGQQITDHFEDYLEEIGHGKGAKKDYPSIRLSRYACYLIVHNADQMKVNVKNGLEYFNTPVIEDKPIDIKQQSNLIFYTTPQGNTRIDLSYDGETFWVTQKKMAELFEVEINTVNYHLGQIFDSGELNKYSVVRKIRITAADGKDYQTLVYNLDTIIAVGYRVNSYKATLFRIWATKVLKEFIVKGFVIDDERLKQGKSFGKDHFEELLERIREIRASERRLYQKITDIYATATDYQKDAPVTKEFYAKVQNKLHWAITGKTAAEIIYQNADATKPFMGLNTWKQAPNGKILRTDVVIAKNYMDEEHILELNQIVSAYLDLAENRAQRQITTSMTDWARFLDSFLELSSYPILTDKGKISAELAKIKAYEQYEQYRAKQDHEYISDFDAEIKKLNTSKTKTNAK
ncbi:MAG: RhuM family protein [Mariniphaga sp.]